MKYTIGMMNCEIDVTISDIKDLRAISKTHEYIIFLTRRETRFILIKSE